MSRLSETARTRVEPELLEALEAEAAAQGRELSQLLRNILRAAMVAAGRLEEAVNRG